jgi:hypothetical protein
MLIWSSCNIDNPSKSYENIRHSNDRENSETDIEEKYAEYHCDVYQNENYSISWKISLIKRHKTTEIISFQYEVWDKNKYEYETTLSSGKISIPIDHDVKLSIDNKTNIYKLNGSFSHLGKFEEYHGRIEFIGKYIHLHNDKEVIEKDIKIFCEPPQL